MLLSGGEQQNAALPDNAAGRYSEVGRSVSIHAPERREHHRQDLAERRGQTSTLKVHFQKLTYRLDGEKGQDMKGINQQGQAVYYNVVTKHGKVRYQIQAASGQTLQGRDRQKRKSRTFAQEHQAAAWLRRNGYEICG